MGTDYAPLVADLFCLVLRLKHSTVLLYLDDSLNIDDDPYFEQVYYRYTPRA